MAFLGGLVVAGVLICFFYWLVWRPTKWVLRKVFRLPPPVGYDTFHYPEKLHHIEGGFLVAVRAMKHELGSEEHLNGFASVRIFHCPQFRNSSDKPIKEVYATYFREWARKHWWQTDRYRYVEDVAEEMRDWVKKEVARRRSEEERKDALSRAYKEKLKKLGAQAKSVADEFHSGVSVSGALSKVDDVGGELSVAQDGAVSLAKKEGVK